MFYDCNGECGGTSTMDECGTCGGNGPEDDYNCQGVPLGFAVGGFQDFNLTPLQSADYYITLVHINEEQIESGIWIGAFSDSTYSTCVGSMQYNPDNCANRICSVVVYGYSSSEFCWGGDNLINTQAECEAEGFEWGNPTEGFMETGDVPTFKIFHETEKVYYKAEPSSYVDLDGDGNYNEWVNQGVFFIEELNVSDDGAPFCLDDCVGIDDIDGDDPMQVCPFLNSVWDIDGSCADDCDTTEDYQTLEVMAYICEGCHDSSDSLDTTCEDWFDIMDHEGGDECGDCHDDCDEFDNTANCHDNCEANECGCGDDLCCQCHDECYDNDDSSDCHNTCDETECSGDDGPPACLNNCVNSEMLDNIESAQDLCNWITAADIGACTDDCDSDIQIELNFYDWMCEGCLAEDPDGTIGTCEYWLEFGDDDGDEHNWACDDGDGTDWYASEDDCNNNCGVDCTFHVHDEDDDEYEISDGCDLPDSPTTGYLHLTSDSNVLYNSPYAIGGLQFDVEGATINSASGGDADDSGMILQTLNSMLLGFFLGGGPIPAGCGTLVELDLDGDATELSGIVMSDANANAIYFEYHGCTLGYDCQGVCGGSVIEDECGICGGEGIADGWIELWGACYDIENTDSLKLSNSGLSATIPTKIGDLTSLTYLDLSDNQLMGEIPSEIENLTNLTYLDLGKNELEGEIPESIGNLLSLQHLSLWENHLTGTIPESLYDLVALEWFDLDFNELSGTISPKIGNLDLLEGFALDNNQLTGSIPSEIGNLTNLTLLYLDDNQLTGEIPESMYELSSLETLTLDNNQLSGMVSDSICNLTELDFATNWSGWNHSYLFNNNFCPPYPECVEEYIGFQDTSGCFDVGDLNLDGEINILDVLSLIFYILPGDDWNNGEPPSEEQAAAADITGDGDINIMDVVYITHIILATP